MKRVIEQNENDENQKKQESNQNQFTSEKALEEQITTNQPEYEYAPFQNHLVNKKSFDEKDEFQQQKYIFEQNQFLYDESDKRSVDSVQSSQFSEDQSENRETEQTLSSSPILSLNKKVILFCFSMVMILIFDEFRKPKSKNSIRKKHKYIHNFLEVREKNQLTRLFEEDWLFIVEFGNDEAIDVLPFLYEINVARVKVDNFETIKILGLMFGSQLNSFIDVFQRDNKHKIFIVKNSALYSRRDDLIHIIDLTQKTDFMNVLDLYVFSFINSFQKKVSNIFTKLCISN